MLLLSRKPYCTMVNFLIDQIVQSAETVGNCQAVDIVFAVNITNRTKGPKTRQSRGKAGNVIGLGDTEEQVCDKDVGSPIHR